MPISPAAWRSSASETRCGAGPVLLRPVLRERRLADDAAGKAQRLDRDAPVLLGREVVRPDRRRRRRIGRWRDARCRGSTAADWQTLAVKAAEGVQALAPFVERQRLEVELEIGGRVVRATERAKAPSCDGAMVSGPVRRKSVFEAHGGPLPEPGIVGVERPDAADLVDRPELQVVLQVLADAGKVRGPPGCRAPASRSASPTPDSSRIFGEPTAPAARITSPAARARWRSPPRRNRTPVARPPSKTARSTSTPVSSRRLGRFSTGLRKPRAALQRRPRFWLTWK